MKLKINKNISLGFIGLFVSFSSLIRSDLAVAQTCASVPSTVVAEAINTSFDYLRPQIHLNQVSSEAVRKKYKNIYFAGDNWVKVAGKRYSLGDSQPYYRKRRSHYVQDLNSVAFRVSPVNNGLRLRVDFETDHSEVKGWCHKCRLRKRRDRAAADMNILPKSGRYPAVEATLDFNYNNGLSNIGLRQVYLDMKLDGNGFLELFDGLIERKVKPKIKNAIYKSWNQSSGEIQQQINQKLGQQLNLGGKSYSVSSISFNGRKANVCVQTR